MAINSIVVEILGVSYPVKGDFDPDHIMMLAERLDARMSELAGYQKVKNLERTAVFTALNLEDELNTKQMERKIVVDLIEEKVNNLISEIDSAIDSI